MKIAQVSPLAESVPPRGYGGTERVVAFLTEALVDQGHEVTLFASGDSETRAELVPCCERGLRREPGGLVEMTAQTVRMLDEVFRRCREFDVIHFHVDYLHFPLSARLCPPNVTTLHGRLDIPNLRPCFSAFSQLPMVSISDAQRAPLPFLNYARTIHHGLPPELFPFSESSSGYLLFLGRLSPEKRCDRAIEIATRAGRELLIAAKLDPNEEAYFDHVIRPLLRRRGVSYLGEVNDDEKRELLAGADAMLFPIDWPEPFGIVMIEAMSMGTPVIAWPMGSVPEVIDEGQTGFVVGSVDEAVRAVERLPGLSRGGCRAGFERRFQSSRMAADYLRVYRAVAREEHEDDATEPTGDGRSGPALPGSLSL